MYIPPVPGFSWGFGQGLIGFLSVACPRAPPGSGVYNADSKKEENHPLGSLPQSSLAMIPLYLSLAALSCLNFAGAVPFHISARDGLHLPLVVKRGPISAEEFIIVASNLRDKYGYPRSSLSKRADVPIADDVCPCSAP